jgi:hypothetical protein
MDLNRLRFIGTNDFQISSSFLDNIFYSSIFLFFVVTRLISLPSIFLSFVGVYFFLGVPYVVGISLCRPFFENKVVEYFGRASKYFVEWVLGVVFLTVLLVTVQFLGWTFWIQNVYIIVLICIVFNVIVSLVRKNEKNYIVFSKSVRYLIVAVLLGIGVVAVIKLFFLPIPDIGFNFDVPYTTYLATARFLENGYVTLAWRWVEFILAGVTCNLLNLDPLYFIAVAPFALIIIYTSGLYLLSHRLLKRPEIALLAVLIGILVNTGSIPNSMFVDNIVYVYRSNTILAAIFPLSLLLMVEGKARVGFSKIKSFAVFLFLLIATLLLYVFFNTSWVHVESLGLPVGFLGYVVFPLASLSIFAVSCFLSYRFKDKKIILTMAILTILLLTFFLTHSIEALLYGLFLSMFSFLSILSIRYKKVISSFTIYTTVLFCFLQARGLISHSLGLIALTQPLSSAYSITGYNDKWTILLDTNNPYNTYLLLILFAASAALILVEKNDYKLTVLTSTWAIILLFFLPELFTYRSYHLLSPLFGITFAYVIYESGKRITPLFNRRKKDD